MKFPIQTKLQTVQSHIFTVQYCPGLDSTGTVLCAGQQINSYEENKIMKILISVFSLIAMMSGTAALADNSYFPLVKCSGGEFVIDEVYVPSQTSFVSYFQFVVRNDAKNQYLVDHGAVSHSFRGEVIIGGAGSDSMLLNNGTRFIANRVYDRNGASRMVAYYAYPTTASTVSLDIYEVTQTGPSSFQNDRMIAQLHFENCQM